MKAPLNGSPTDLTMRTKSMLSSRPPSRSSLKSDSARPTTGHVSFKYYLPDITSPFVTEPTWPQHATRQAVATMSPDSQSLVHGYMVCGLARLPEDWALSDQTATTKAYRTPGSIGPYIQPTVLGSIPAQDKDAATAQMFSSALKAAFPNDAEVCASLRPPVSTCHGIVLQMHSSQSLYGVALKLWVKSDVERTDKILEVLSPKEATKVADNTTLWMPYCLAYLSHYPLFDLMSDYLRCTWMLYGKDPDKFNSNGVLRMTRLPPPQADQILRIELDRYTFSYQMPAHPQNFQNFALWPIFTCLTPTQVIAILEAALSPKGRIIFTSQYPSMMTIASETVRYYVKSWAGLYVPTVYGSRAQELLNEDAPYILGLTKQSRAQVTAPRDALVVDLDLHRIYTSRPPGSLSPRQRKKYAALLHQALFHADVNGPPQHLKTAYEQENRFSAVGSMIGTGSTPRTVAEPAWWEAARVLSAIQHICKRVRQNYKLLSALDTVRKQSVKVDIGDLNRMIHDRNHFARNSVDAWETYIKVKRRTDAKVSELLKRQATLESNVADGKKEFAELSEATSQLIEDTRQLQKVANQQKKDNARMEEELQEKILHARQLSSHVTELENEISDANDTLAMQQELIEEIERSRDAARTFETRFEAVSQERDEAHRAVIHLTSLISGQIAYIERVLGSLVAPSRPASRTESRNSRRRSFQNMGPGADAVIHGRKKSTDSATAMNTPLASSFASQVSPVRSSSPLTQVENMDDELSLKEKVGAVAATVRKINQQCLAAIKDLADRRNELDAPAITPDLPETSEDSHDSPTSSESENMAPRLTPSMRERRRELHDSDTVSVAESRGSIFSSTPDLDSRASTVCSNSVSGGDPRDEYTTPTPNTLAIEPRIQAILEVDEDVEEAFVDLAPAKLISASVEEVDQSGLLPSPTAAIAA